MNFKSRRPGRAFLLSLLLITAAGCNSGGGNSGNSSNPDTNPTNGVVVVSGCTATSSGSTWVPDISNAGESNHNSNIAVSTTVLTQSAPLSGLGDPIHGREATLTFDVPTDLGLNGSVTLTAQVTGYPSGVSATAFPVLTYLSDGHNDYINLPRDASGNVSCGQGGGFYTCSGGACNANPDCQTVGYPSGYTDFTHYWQHQVPNWGYESVNRFPTCRWSEGNATTYSASSPACAFNTYLQPSVTGATAGHLPPGRYTAKYFLMTDGYSSIPSGYNATLKVTVTEKSDTVDTTVGGAVDVNVILVGSKNIADSHTTAGQRNLDTLFYSFGNYLQGAYQGVNNSNIKVGKVNVYELSCQQGGDALATISTSQLGTLLQAGSAAIGSATEGKALNIFLISEFSDSSAVLGISGAIGGPPINGLQTSGLAFATFNMLQDFNPTCNTDPCPTNEQDSDFYEMGNTIAHETGHFLGLNHPSEATGGTHDPVYDTPICTAQDPLANNQISINSCLNNDVNVFGPTGKTCSQACPPGNYNPSLGEFCPDARECAFNHMMWYQSKHFDPSTGTADGNQFSPESGIIMNYSSYVQ